MIVTPAPQEDLDAQLAAALTRYLATKDARDYIRKVATPWLAKQPTTATE